MEKKTTTPKINHYEADNAFSLEERHRMGAFYRQYFGCPEVLVTEVKSELWQKRGVDVCLKFPSGHTINIDEKKRRGNWDDILIERWSNEKYQTPGWLFKDEIFTDYIVYLFPNSNVIILPMELLRTWVRQNERRLTTFKEVRAENPTYTSVSYAVPIQVLLDGLKKVMIGMY